MGTKDADVRYGSLDHIVGWVQAYRQSMQERKVWEDQKNAYERKWRDLNEKAKDIILVELESQGAEIGTVGGHPAIRAMEYKRSGYEVAATVVRRIQVLGDDSA